MIPWPGWARDYGRLTWLCAAPVGTHTICTTGVAGGAHSANQPSGLFTTDRQKQPGLMPLRPTPRPLPLWMGRTSRAVSAHG